MESINNQEQKNEKVADNIISERKQQIYQIEDRIDSEKNKLNKISDIEDNFIALNKSLNRCIEVVSSSVKSTKNTYM